MPSKNVGRATGAWPAALTSARSTDEGAEPLPHLHLCVCSRQLGHLFKGSLVFLWSEANLPAALLGRDLSH